jgi:hypothetical protein
MESYSLSVLEFTKCLGVRGLVLVVRKYVIFSAER